MADDDEDVCLGYARILNLPIDTFRSAWQEVEKNVRTVLNRQFQAQEHPSKDRPICKFKNETMLLDCLEKLSVRDRLYTLARVYDAAHMELCRDASWKKGVSIPTIDFRQLSEQIQQDPLSIRGRIVFQKPDNANVPIDVVWEEMPEMSFDHLTVLEKLSHNLPGEQNASSKYAGIGGGGGSDVISAALIGELLYRHNKKMNLLISTRTWDTGSQGKNGSKIGIRREVRNHGGYAAIGRKGVGGTYRIRDDTTAEGRDLEAIPLQASSKRSPDEKKKVFMILDQSQSKSDIPEIERATLETQIEAVLAQEPEVETLVIAALNVLSPKGTPDRSKDIETVVSVDTGGDVFGANNDGSTTPDQDFRVQRAITRLDTKKNLVTAVVAPGVDAPDDAMDKAQKAGGRVYHLCQEERDLLLDTLKRYQMDGSNENRFGKTTLALQASLRGQLGWRSLNLPEYVVNTWENPWSSFVYVRKCMSDIIFMPTKQLLPVISPKTVTNGTTT